ncbi:MAG: TonB-dependent receptor plug domain-containing protein [Dysgonamonadaceae bacterium]|jgi:hypothetical protein|nr:TonB-dependent receptor plug domain-containing protein [Dysgonamonadaceae bacterium]
MQWYNRKLYGITLLCGLLAYPLIGQTTAEEQSSLDTVVYNISSQVLAFPQEKIYVQTDKPYYVAGEKLFYRIYLLNACFHLPGSISRYVYVELLDPTDSVVVRQKIRPEAGLFYNALSLSEKLPQGTYRMRAYTRYMENLDESYFFSKPLYIATPGAAAYRTELKVEMANHRETEVEVRFFDSVSNDTVLPDRINARLERGKVKSVKPQKDGRCRLKFNLTEDSLRRSMLIEYLEDNNCLFKQFVEIPFVENKVAVTFYPEGGYMVEDRACNVAFKALLPNGRPAEIGGDIFDGDSVRIGGFYSRHDGMGKFSIYPIAGKEYFLVFEYENQQYRVKIPEIKPDAIALKTVWRNDNLWIAVNKSPRLPASNLYLLIHCRGDVIYFREWKPETEVVFVEGASFRSGVTHILLLSEDLQPLSERLVFKYNNNDVGVAVTPDKTIYQKREKVELDLALDHQFADTIPASFSIAVTDDHDVTVDTCSSILSEILLSSELKGTVINPAYYLGESTEAAANADLLMMTHGWNRYNIPDAIHRNFQLPTIMPEIAQSFSGMVKGGLLSKPYKQANVMLLSTKIRFFDMTVTDDEGRYRFENFEFPDSTQYVIQALSKKGSDAVELIPDEIRYPAVSDSSRLPAPATDDILIPDESVSKAEKRVTMENGMRLIYLPEVTVSAKRKTETKYRNTYGTNPDYTLTEEYMENFSAMDLKSLLYHLPGVTIQNNKAVISRYGQPAMIVVDGVRYTDDDNILDIISVADIGQIDLIKDPASLTIYNAPNGVIEIMTKRGEITSNRVRFNIKTFMPLGYQTPVEFYSPRYDTPEAYANSMPDLRSTIYWKPDVIPDLDGRASVDFYTADSPTSYSVVIEGVCPDGRLIYRRANGIIRVKQE